MNRREWPEMSLWGRLWYCVATLIYIALVGLMTGFLVDQGLQGFKPNARLGDAQVNSSVFIIAGCVGGAVVLAIQLYRIGLSRRRARSEHKLNLAEFLFDLQWNLHLKGLIVLVVVWSLAMAWKAAAR